MPEVNSKTLADKLLASGFERNSPSASALTDPIADTPMVVTLDELRPYELDPRLTRNPLFDDIKASIRERGLDAPPPITRRPGADHYIIRNGGNTRLAILRELWSDTKEERFFRIACLFRPWPERGEIIALTGHLAENELHGGLSFIERALGVAKARELYEQESGQPLSQSELARRLKADGYPVPQPHISRMQEAIQHLLPAIPTVLYAGLGRPQIEQLTNLRRAGERAWSARCEKVSTTIDFATLFQDVLALFDDAAGNFNTQRVQDELIGQMADLLQENYDTLAFEMIEADKRWQLLGIPPTVAPGIPVVPSAPKPKQVIAAAPSSLPKPESRPDRPSMPKATDTSPSFSDEIPPHQDALVQQHIVSPAQTTERLQSIQKLIAEQLDETPPPDFASNVLQSIPVQAGGLYPISDVWYIDPGIDIPDRLRIHIAQFAREIAAEVSLPDCIEDRDDGIGFICRGHSQNMPASAHAALALLSSLAGQQPADIGLDHELHRLPALLHGQGDAAQRLSDTALVKFFRLLRLARRLFDLEASVTDNEG